MTYAHSEYLISPQELMQQLNEPSLEFTTHLCSASRRAGLYL